jgi:cellulose synthase/poly-beta-1,6-N-acetylglucosamine synthase-like glycosyltransferase
MSFVVCVLYAVVLGILCIYGIHRSYLVFTAARLHSRMAVLKRGVPELPRSSLIGGLVPAECGVTKLPTVTIQLAIFNEATVIRRLLDAVARIEYPRELLEIQVLDDSTDETCAIARQRVAELCATGRDVSYMHRVDRVGYKAGALAAGLEVAKGELLALFDADFVPPPDFLRKVVPHFADADVAMVQTRWGHLNREHSILTRVAALMLDGHHLIENRVRAAAGWLFNFSGTGGVWRKHAIVQAGGWEHDTLTEDLDLSYRAQLAGWRFVYREDVVTPAELPEDMSAFRAQQTRWAQGTVQTARKLLRRVLSSDLRVSARIEAFFHLTPHFAYPLTMTLSIILLPLALLIPASNTPLLLAIDVPLFLGTTGSLAAFYAMAERAQGRRARDAIVLVPAIIAVGVGLAPLVTRALLRGLRSMAGEFVRTPKKGSTTGARYRSTTLVVPAAETALSAVSLVSTIASVHTGHLVATPFAALFTIGYAYMAGAMLLEQMQPATAAPSEAQTAPVTMSMSDAE